ncbi:Prospero domain-containing protein [Trichostrongylus colubriformis]|uniref:Prospero domain-containing protein n=1 Tax=Trichostrongylus colubriformis TaxID=6319 RepID=A0AAN8F759_TRICO
MDLTNSTEEIDQLDVETAEDQTAELVNDDVAVGEPRLSNESANSTASSSSSSKRKSFQPQKNIEDVEHLDEDDDDENPSQDINTNDDGLVKSEDKPETENSRQFEGLSALQSQLNQPNMKFQEIPFEDDGPKKKRSKVTDSVRKMNGTPMAREGSPSSTRSSPVLSHSTPLSNYFPPTMVGHPLYGGASFGEREGSPTNSDETSECGGYDNGQSSTLTPVHLRKAKLMFFYTRYPNSTLLKSYFPDVRFNKNNTAQLVINRLDDQIPEYFKDPNFLERLE